VCVGGDWTSVPLKPGCTLVPPTDEAFCDGDPRRKEFRCWTPDVPGVWLPYVHQPCAHNAMAGLCLRTLGLCPPASNAGGLAWTRSFSELRAVLRGRIPEVVPWELGRVVESYRVRRLRTRYEEAHRSLLDDGFSTPRDARVSAFVKAEKLSGYKVHKPRVIMGRSPRYNLELASYLKPLEHVLYPALRGWGRGFLTHTRLIGKGLNGRQRASLIRRKFESQPGLVAFEVDCKSFESHLSKHQLQLEHGVYNSLVRDPRLAQLLSWQLEFDGHFSSGVKYHASGVRASGDFNTGLGNTLIMVALGLAVARDLGLKFDLLADGDNAVFFVRGVDLPLWHARLPEVFLEMGHEAEVGGVAYCVEEVVFGQSKPVQLSDGWRMVRDPLKVMSHACCSHVHFSEMRGGLSVLKAVGFCEATLGAGVPVLQEFAHAILRATRGARFSRAELPELRLQSVLESQDTRVQRKRLPISDATRVSFYKAWGVDVGEQHRLEKYFSEVTIHWPKGWDDVPLDRTFSGVMDPWGLPLGRVEAEWMTHSSTSF